MIKPTHSKNHHYVPQFLLKNFCFGKKNKVWVYDKKLDKKFETNIRNVASETKFYEMQGKEIIQRWNEDWKRMISDAPEGIKGALEKGEFNVSMEKGFNVLEENVSTIIQRIIKNNTIADLSADEKAVVALFFAVQMVRTKTYIDKIKYTNELLLKKIMEMGFTKEQASKSFPLDDTDLKFFHMRQITDANKFLPYFLDKIWVLYKTSAGFSFYIGDNPIVLQNQNDTGFRGNLGLAVKGIEIYLPIAKNYVLALLCPSIGDMIIDVENKLNMVPNYQPVVGRDYIMQMFRGIRTGAAVQIRAESITNLNYLQVLFSSRFVFANKDEFSLVEEMIKDDDNYREFLKPKVG
jgi:hypothetical protein